MIPGVSKWKHLAIGSNLQLVEGYLRQVNSLAPGLCKHPCPVNSCGYPTPSVSEKHHGKPKICLKQDVVKIRTLHLFAIFVTTATIANGIRRPRGSKTGHKDHLIQSTPCLLLNLQVPLFFACQVTVKRNSRLTCGSHSFQVNEIPTVFLSRSSGTKTSNPVRPKDMGIGSTHSVSRPL